MSAEVAEPTVEERFMEMRRNGVYLQDIGRELGLTRWAMGKLNKQLGLTKKRFIRLRGATLKQAMVYAGLIAPFFETMRDAIEGQSAIAIAEHEGVTPHIIRCRLRYLVRRGYLEAQERSGKRTRFVATPKGMESRRPINLLFDLTLRLYLHRGGPLTSREIAEGVLVSTPYASRLLANMARAHLVRSVGREKRGLGTGRGRGAMRYAITHVGIERLNNLASADWRARLAAVLPEAA